MRSARAAIALDPRLFGRGPTRVLAVAEPDGWSLSDDARLFATTFAAGFLFISILVA